MLVSHRKKFIFLKTLKTAGTSVESFFEKYCFPDGQWAPSHWRDEYISESGIVGHRLGGRGTVIPEGVIYRSHMSAMEIKTALDERIWNEYFKFTVVRNPFDKMVSAFYHFEKKQKSEKYRNRKESDVVLFREWVAAGGAVVDRHMYVLDEKICVNYFIRYESLVSDIVELCDRLNITDCDVSSIPQYKSGIRSQEFSLQDMYDEETENIVRKKFKFEIENFDYSLDRG